MPLSGGGSVCANGLAFNDGANKLYETVYRSVSLNIVGTTSLGSVDGGTLTAGESVPVRQQQSGVPGRRRGAPPRTGRVPHAAGDLAVGKVGGLITDNNATSQFAVLDLATGKQVAVVSGLNFVSSPFGGEVNSQTERSAQFDPATRTGWVPSADGRQLQQFRY